MEHKSSSIWFRYPQQLWVRQLLFRVHRWTGLGVGLYVFVMSVTGSSIVHRDELSLAFARALVIVTSQAVE